MFRSIVLAGIFSIFFPTPNAFIPYDQKPCGQYRYENNQDHWSDYIDVPDHNCLGTPKDGRFFIGYNVPEHCRCVFYFSPTCVPEGGVREVREEGMGSLGRSYLSVKCNNI